MRTAFMYEKSGLIQWKSLSSPDYLSPLLRNQQRTVHSNSNQMQVGNMQRVLCSRIVFIAGHRVFGTRSKVKTGRDLTR